MSGLGKSLAAVLFLLALAAGCAGTKSGVSMQSQLSTSLPALSELRSAASAVNHYQNGCLPLSYSSGFSAEGIFGRLDSASGGFVYAVYGFAPGEEPLIEASVKLTELNNGGQLYLCCSNYSANRWDISGPFSPLELPTNTTLPLDSQKDVSAAGMVYLALIAPQGSAFLVESVSFRTEVNQAPVAILEADISSGDPPLDISFSAAASSDAEGGALNFEWDWDGDGIYEADSGTVNVRSHTYDLAGFYRPRLRVTDEQGLSAVSAPVEITAHGIRSRVLVQPQNPGYAISLQLIDGRPRICFVFGNELAFSESSTEFGTGPSDWSSVILNTPYATGGSFTSLADVGGRPAILVNTSTASAQPALLYAYSPSGSPLLQANWHYTQVDILGAASSSGALCVVQGNPAAVYDVANPVTIRYARSSTASGAAPSDWVGVDVVPSKQITFDTPSLTLIGGNPAFVYRGSPGEDLFYVRSSSALGLDPLDWQSVDLITAGGIADASLTEVQGHAAIAYELDVVHDLRYHWSTTPLGLDPLAWLDVEVESTGIVGGNCLLITPRETPWIAYAGSDSQSIRLAQSGTATGAGADEWLDPVVPTGDDNPLEKFGFADINGFPALAYADQTDGVIRYAVFF